MNRSETSLEKPGLRSFRNLPLPVWMRTTAELNTTGKHSAPRKRRALAEFQPVNELTGFCVPTQSGRGSRRLAAALRPRPGRKLPDDLRAENVGRLTAAFSQGVRDVGFEQLVEQIDTGPIHVGEQVRVFFDGDEAFASILDAIGHAQQEVLLETYILRDDAAGNEILQRLGRAAGRGVSVRVLADAFGSWTTRRSFWLQMRQLGIQARLFHPFWFSIWDHLVRDHRKIIVIDRQTAFTGGMNIGNEYGSSRRIKGRRWRDTHARIEGSTAWEMALVFREGWVRAGGESFAVPKQLFSNGEGARILVLDSRPGRGYAETAAVLAAIVGACRRRLWVTNSYFAPRRLLLHLLVSAAHRGVDVRLLLPGVSDIPLVRHAGHGCFADLLASGVRIFEYQPAVLHAKTLVADDYVSVIGSSNLDVRSFHFNAECNVLVLDEDTARDMARAFEADLRDSVEIRLPQWEQRPWWRRVRDTLARHLTPVL